MTRSSGFQLVHLQQDPIFGPTGTVHSAKRFLALKGPEISVPARPEENAVTTGTMYLGNEKDEERFTEMAKDPGHGNRHASKVSERVAHKNLGRVPVEHQQPQSRSRQGEHEIQRKQMAIPAHQSRLNIAACPCFGSRNAWMPNLLLAHPETCWR